MEQLKSGPHPLPIGEHRQGVCYSCLLNKEIAATFEDFKGEKHDLCSECGWAVSEELEKQSR